MECSIQLESNFEPYAECGQSKILDFYHTEEERMVNYSGNWKYVDDLDEIIPDVLILTK